MQKHPSRLVRVLIAVVFYRRWFRYADWKTTRLRQLFSLVTQIIAHTCQATILFVPAILPEKVRMQRLLDPPSFKSSPRSPARTYPVAGSRYTELQIKSSITRSDISCGRFTIPSHQPLFFKHHSHDVFQSIFITMRLPSAWRQFVTSESNVA